MFVLAQILPLLFAAQTPPEPSWNCDDPMVQQEMNWCAHQDYLAADAAMNAQWKITSAEMKERDNGATGPKDERADYFGTLIEAQRAWLTYRDAHCRSEGYYAYGGSLEPLLVSSCKAQLTRQRTDQLVELVEQ